jgi:hypothetical protein
MMPVKPGSLHLGRRRPVSQMPALRLYFQAPNFLIFYFIGRLRGRRYVSKRLRAK